MRRLRPGPPLCLALAACATAPRVAAPSAAYRCADGSEIALAREPGSVRVRLGDGTWTLPRLAGGGERYGNGELLVVVTGSAVRVERGGAVLHAGCERA